ncbi:MULTISPECIES: NAD(P)H-dependent oxidoreductase [unclassified Clostridioides]|uniref:flavodoxin family protein n=1 Tax=unclassified Clostridioides TaxID=2635829 RepID=UPI001D11832C|nr:NAD(P)H-dependent oxidoreductase [Clostridioides sp. ZZV14-6150]MCC0723762.1 NAD(P)H-dependent oxidoreductase [Clostridioides sp. ZZV14-6104]MCC0742195.1 NAD(P)H-dependent oxidoreductase [Clostridioides sp. ZZV14-6044]MCC0752147.1 NAD(P)H-dependent oxidoreductase [Clostridioides sp. ZZV13-5731]
MKVAVIFHSVCGSTYLLAREYKKVLEEMNIEVDIFKVSDEVAKTLPQYYLINSKEYKDEFESINVIKSGKELLDYDVIFMGSPTYYGNVSGQMKMFMDSFSDVWVGAPLSGKIFGCFATSGSQRGGGELALQSMNIFAQHMGMTLLSVPCMVIGGHPAYGILHIAGDNSDIRPSDDVKFGIRDYLNNLSIYKK